MTGSPRLPDVPAAQRVTVLAAALVLGLAVAAGGVTMLLQGGLLPAVAGALLLLADALSVGYLLRFLSRPRGAPVVLERDGATVLPEATSARVTAWGSVAASLGFLAVLALGAVTEEITPGSSVGVVVAVAVLLLAVPTLLGVLHRRVRPGELVLTTQQVRLSTWNADRAVAWDDVVEVVLLARPRRTLVVYAGSPEQIDHGRRPVGPGERQARPVAGADRALAVSVPHLSGDPELIATALEHWRTTPSDRHQIGTPAARARLGSGTVG